MSARHRVSKLLLRQRIIYSGGRTWTAMHEAWLRGQRFGAATLQLAYETALDTMLADLYRVLIGMIGTPAAGGLFGRIELLNAYALVGSVKPEKEPRGWRQQAGHSARGDHDGVAYPNGAALPVQRARVVLQVNEPARLESVGQRNDEVCRLLDGTYGCGVAAASASAADVQDREDAVGAASPAHPDDHLVGEALVALALGVDHGLITPAHSGGNPQPPHHTTR